MEIDIIQKVELRLLLANTDEKFNASLDVFLVPLLQKFTSTDFNVLSKLVEVLKFVKQRRRDSDSITFPIEKLIELYKNSVLDVKLARQNRQVLSFIALELSLKKETKVDISLFTYGLRLDTSSASQEVLDLAGEQFSLFLLILTRGNELYNSKSGVPICDITQWDTQDLSVVTSHLTDLFLVDLRHRTMNNQYAVSPERVKFLVAHGMKLGIECPQLNDAPITAVRRAAFELASNYPSTFKNILVAAMGDPVLEISRDARTEVIKMKELDQGFVEFVAAYGNSQLRSGAMDLLSRFKYFDKVNAADIKTALNHEDLKLRQAALILLRDAVTNHKSKGQPIYFNSDEALKFSAMLKQYIFDDGWPRPQIHSKIQTQMRQICYELLGSFSVDKSNIVFLLQSLDKDSPEMASSIQKALSDVMSLHDVEVDGSKLLDFMLNSSNNRTRYSAVSLSSKLTPSPLSKTIALLGLDKHKNSSDVVMEAQRCLLTTDIKDLPSYADMLKCTSDVINLNTASADLIEITSLYLFACLIRFPPSASDWISELKISLDSSSKSLDGSLPESVHFVTWLFDLMSRSPQFTEALPMMLRKLLLALNSEQVNEFSGKINSTQLRNTGLIESNPYGSFLAEYSALVIKTQVMENDSPLSNLFNAYQCCIYGRENVEEVASIAESTNNVDAVQVLAASGLLKHTPQSVISKSPFVKACWAINNDIDDRIKCLDELLSSSPKHFDELVSNGEAISIIISGWNSKALQRRYPYLTRNSERSWELEERALKKVAEGIRGSPHSRRVASVNLLCLSQNSFYGISLSPGIAKGIQSCFMSLLNDSDDVTQESAGRGLSILFENSNNNKTLQDSLVHTLLSSFTDDTAAKQLQSGNLTADTQVFHPGVLPSDPRGNGSISTYKDIMNLANETGDSSLVYKFMALSSNSAIWTSRKGIAFSLQQIISKSEIAKQILSRSEIGLKLIPKLFRYLYDPSEVTKNSMKHIWSALIPSSLRSTVIKLYLPEINTELTNGISDRQWRVRQASCLALSDMISNGNIKSTIEVWRIGFRAIDDIKESVATAGAELIKSLSRSLLRSQNTSEGDLREIIPFLVSGLGTKSSESYALDTLLKLTETEMFAPFAAEVLTELCLQLSSLEPQALNYLALNTSQKLVDDARVHGLRSSPIMKGLETMVERGQPSNSEMWKLLPNLVKNSVGVPSKLAAARLLTLTCIQTYGGEKNASERLLTVTYNEIWSKNEVISETYASAIGYLCRQLPLQLVIGFITELRKNYIESESDDSVRRIAIANALGKVSTNSSDVFSSVASIALPLAFVAMSSGIEKETKLFRGIWESNTGGSASLKLYGSDIIMFSKEVLERSSSRSLKVSAAKAISEVMEINGALKVGISDVVMESAAVLLLENTAGRSWPQKEYIFGALVSLYPNVSEEMKRKIEERALNEVARRNEEYKLGILPSIAQFFTYLDHNSEIKNQIETQMCQNVIDVCTENDEAQIDAYKAALSSTESSTLKMKMIDHSTSLGIWQFNVATCIAIRQQSFDSEVWANITRKFMDPKEIEAVKQEWARSALHFKEIPQVADDILKYQKS